MKPATSLCCLRRSVETRLCTNNNPPTATTVATATIRRPVRTRIIGNLLPEHACSSDQSFGRWRIMMPNAVGRRDLPRRRNSGSPNSQNPQNANFACYDFCAVSSLQGSPTGHLIGRLSCEKKLPASHLAGPFLESVGGL